MKFDALDKQMRVYETASDTCVLPGLFMVARVDGRSFTRLTKEICKFDSPFDAKFRDLMVVTAKQLMNCGFEVAYAYTESDEISLLLRQGETQFGRKLRKLNSVLAGEASAAFSLALGKRAVFDCRISQLPSSQLVKDYFRWRGYDSVRNALNAYCYWSLRKSGWTKQNATARLIGLGRAQKQELLFGEFGINFNDLPTWQKRGVGLMWVKRQRSKENPHTGESVSVLRRELVVCDELPAKSKYDDFLDLRIAEAE